MDSISIPAPSPRKKRSGKHKPRPPKWNRQKLDDKLLDMLIDVTDGEPFGVLAVAMLKLAARDARAGDEIAMRFFESPGCGRLCDALGLDVAIVRWNARRFCSLRGETSP